MDNVTHSLVGLNLAEGFFKKRFPEAVPALVLSSNLPDLDVACLLSGSPLAVTWRRTFGHSVFTIPIATLCLAWLLRRRYQRSSLGALWGVCLFGAFLHVFFDLINSFGVVPLWPISDWRPELAIVFIIDLCLLTLLGAPHLTRLFESLKPRLPQACRVSSLLVAAYLAFCGANRAYAQLTLDSEAFTDRSKFSYVFPEALGPHRWRLVSLDESDGRYRVILFNTFTNRASPAEIVPTFPDDPAVRAARATPAGKRLEWFFKAPVWISEKDGVHVSDLRFHSLVLGRAKSFGFTIGPDGAIKR
jgi:inner membrane protein